MEAPFSFTIIAAIERLIEQLKMKLTHTKSSRENGGRGKVSGKHRRAMSAAGALLKTSAVKLREVAFGSKDVQALLSTKLAEESLGQLQSIIDTLRAPSLPARDVDQPVEPFAVLDTLQKAVQLQEEVVGICRQAENSPLPQEELERHAKDLTEQVLVMLRGILRRASEHVSRHVFISHASMERESVASPLYDALEAAGVRCFIDRENFEVGLPYQEQLQNAILESRAAVFVLSPNFVRREWPMWELFEFLRRAEEAGSAQERPLLIPLFYGLQVEQCRSAESLAGLGPTFFPVTQVTVAIQRLAQFAGVLKDEGMSDQEYVGHAARMVIASLDLHDQEFHPQ